MTATASRRSLPDVGRLVATAAVPASAVLGNVLAYGLLLVAARVLSHQHYGSFVALTTIVVVGAVPSLAMQAVTARRVAAGEATGGISVVTWCLALGIALLLAAVTVPLAAFLHIDSTPAVLWVAVSLLPMTLFAPIVGAPQGAQRLTVFAGLSLLQAGGRFGGCLMALVVSRSEAWAMFGAALGTAVALVVSTAVVRRLGLTLSRARGAAWSVFAESWHALHGYAAILVLTGLDLLLARHLVSSEQAAQYAGGSVVTKAVVWLPQSIGLIVFARMSVRDRHLAVARRSVAVVAGIGGLAAGGCAVFGGLASAVVGGRFHLVESAGWIFALLGTGLAVLQFTVVAGLASRRSRTLLVPWLTVVAEVAVLLSLGSGTARHVVVTATVVVGIGAALAVWLVAGLPVPGRTSATVRTEPAAR